MGDFVKLYRNYNDPLIPVHSSDSDGTFELNKGYHDIKILIYDAQKNVRIVNGTLFFMNPYEIDVTNLGEANNIVSFLLSPKSIAIPIKSAIIYSFTPFGFADERIDEFCDVNSFREFAGLTGTATYDNATLSSFIPKGSVEGFCSINGKRGL